MANVLTPIYIKYIKREEEKNNEIYNDLQERQT
jgi:hypothetical protein